MTSNEEKYASILIRDGATPKAHGKIAKYRTRLQFICECGNNGEKLLCYIEKTGAFCSSCGLIHAHDKFVAKLASKTPIDIMNNKEEKWIKIKETFDKYEISNFGRLRNVSTKRMIKWQGSDYPSKSIKIGPNKAISVLAHIAVAKAFVPNSDPDNNIFVDHIDGEKKNYISTNLRWCTPKQNSKWAKELNSTKNKKQSRRILQFKPSGELIKIWNDIKEIEKTMQFHGPSLLRVCNGKAKTYKKYRWSFQDNDLDQQPDDEIYTAIGQIDGFDASNYMISNYGKVKNIQGKEISYYERNGYRNVNLAFKKKKRNFRIHRLVAEKFVEGRNELNNIVHHINEVKDDNFYRNLEWTNQQRNVAASLGRSIEMLEKKTGKMLKQFACQREAADFLQRKNCSSVSDCCNGRQKSAYGYRWRYAAS